MEHSVKDTHFLIIKVANDFIFKVCIVSAGIEQRGGSINIGFTGKAHDLVDT